MPVRRTQLLSEPQSLGRCRHSCHRGPDSVLEAESKEEEEWVHCQEHAEATQRLRKTLKVSSNSRKGVRVGVSLGWRDCLTEARAVVFGDTAGVPG